jgi:hypothetical protein
MKRKALSAFLIAMLSGGVAFADTEQTVYVNGQETGGFVTLLTFSGNNVTMTFEDETLQTVDMSLVSIDLTYNDDTSGITEVETTDKQRNNRIYTISGQFVGTSKENLPAGIYIVNGKKFIKK